MDVLDKGDIVFMIYQVLKWISSQNTDSFNDQTYWKYIHIIFVPKFTIYNHLHNYHNSFINNIFV